MFPNSQRINRGNYEVKQLVDACRANDVTDLILLHEHRGVPGNINFLELLSWPQADKIFFHFHLNFSMKLILLVNEPRHEKTNILVSDLV